MTRMSTKMMMMMVRWLWMTKMSTCGEVMVVVK